MQKIPVDNGPIDRMVIVNATHQHNVGTRISYSSHCASCDDLRDAGTANLRQSTPLRLAARRSWSRWSSPSPITAASRKRTKRYDKSADHCGRACRGIRHNARHSPETLICLDIIAGSQW